MALGHGFACPVPEVPIWAQWTTEKVVILYWLSGHLLWVGRDRDQAPSVYARTVVRSG